MVRLERKTLIINGAERSVLCNPEQDSLGFALRRLGLTGVKLGCKKGVCGACSVLLDGKVVRSCARKMKNVEERVEIITIEGIGTPMNLHPLQQAWITYGGVQCGFCTPGFIVSAYGLLRQNLSPTREDVRAWFERHRNICRCTGYIPLVDAVMAAAEVMRGEKTMEDISFRLEGDIYGSKYPRPSALAKVCGVSDFGDDVALKMPEGTAYLAPVLSKVSHGKLIGLDVSEAEKMPGVIKVLTAKDIKGQNIVLGLGINHPRERGEGGHSMAVMAERKINKRGEVLALVAADTEDNARKAAGMVRQNVEPLPEYLNYLDAVAPNAIEIFEGTPNMHCMQPLLKGEDTREIMDDSAFVVEGSFATQHEPHLPIEPDTVQGYWGADGMLTIQGKSQFLALWRANIAVATGIAPEKVRVIMNPAGGSFGYAVQAAQGALVATAVINLNMPCSMTLSYEEHNLCTGKRTASHANGRLACDKNGKITAAEWDIGIDHGAYADIADQILHSVTRMAYHGYNIPNIMALARISATNLAQCSPYRGFGTPQINASSEALSDMLAVKAGMDPFEFRYINMAKPGDLNINSYLYKDYPMVQLMDIARPHYKDFKDSAAKNSTATKKRGVGVSVGGFNVTLGPFDSAEVALELNADGTVTHYNTWQDVGQGGDIGTLTHTVKALAALNLKPEQVRLVTNDTKRCPDTSISAASRSHYMAGNATLNAAEKLLDAMRKKDGSFRSYDEMVKDGIPTKYVGRYDQSGLGLTEPSPNTGVGDRTPEYMYCVNLAEVEVDVETGKTKILRFTAVSDCGVIGNRLAVDGQAYGGLSHSMGYALSEEYSDPDKHTNIAACGLPTIEEIPDKITVIHVENPRRLGPNGSGGLSENFQSSGHMAVINAIANAIGARVYELPAKPEKVKAALEAKRRGEDLKPKKYFLGSDFYEELDDIRANPL
jgi:aldehyde oxidoreductase